MQSNNNSIRANGDSLLRLVSTLNHKFDIIRLTEKQLIELEQAALVFQNYKSYYSKRLNRREWGAAVFILKSEPMIELTVNLPHFEAVFVKVNLPNKFLMISSIYRPPITNLIDFKAHIGNNMLSTNRCETYHIIRGNFNLDLLKINRINGISSQRKGNIKKTSK